MDEKQLKSTSKFLSLVLRHQPDKIGVELDEQGWIDVDTLLAAMNRSGKKLTVEQLREVVTKNDKQRFKFSDDQRRIRANQGHSVEVELGYEPAEPPEFLLHGTPAGSVAIILETGLKKMARHHVHLHHDRETASAVGQRRGKPVLLQVASGRMHGDGYLFYVTPNQVWLTDEVPPAYIHVLQ
ncbi:RNA 2'-phosphotransferase [Blastopirellula sp. JC732]|uniref:Probable RNA 2'-phosphotransferase n=1 Tax=Blastopirellula sediminis TaxID=2894196 RepID=A0A9X1MJR0_9BACT|nr:RNA 2'-phosphotransferase [Blastopirellula sediminis]MCC9609227.1 RNA 2'-phosphotransferase [Blastopirellula sediminis]MCC9627996.1 RNA 2'-phosphotransferase [Blastopirellula sediminis]